MTPFLEIPFNVAAGRVIAAPVLAAIGAIAALVSDLTIVVEKVQEKPKAKDSEEVRGRADPPPS